MTPGHRIYVTADRPEMGDRALKGLIRRCVRGALREEGVDLPCEISVRLTDNEGIRALNREYRNLDRPTDVLSFPMFELTPGQPLPEAEADSETGLFPLGDIAISLERAEEQAAEYGHSPRREAGFLTVHSILHLLGYDHMDEGEQKRAMRAREEDILDKLGLRREEGDNDA